MQHAMPFCSAYVAKSLRITCKNKRPHACFRISACETRASSRWKGGGRPVYANAIHFADYVQSSKTTKTLQHVTVASAFRLGLQSFIFAQEQIYSDLWRCASNASNGANLCGERPRSAAGFHIRPRATLYSRDLNSDLHMKSRKFRHARVGAEFAYRMSCSAG